MSGWDVSPSEDCGSIHGYKLEKQIGRGGQGVVFKGIDTSTGKHVAIKRLEIGPSSVQEIQNLNACLHLPSVVGLQDFVKEGKYKYIVMELMDHSLKTVIQKLDEDSTRKVMQRVLKGVADLHQIGVVHRDLKIDNILMSADGGDVKICDLGLAKLYNSCDCCLPSFQRCARPAGTRSYIAPEMLRREDYSTAVDLWSAGCVMAELILNGKRLFPGPDASDQLAQIYNLFDDSVLPKLGKMIPPSKLSSQGFDFLRKLLAVDPCKRISACEAIRHPWFSMCAKRKTEHPRPPWHY